MKATAAAVVYGLSGFLLTSVGASGHHQSWHRVVFIGEQTKVIVSFLACDEKPQMDSIIDIHIRFGHGAALEKIAEYEKTLNGRGEPVCEVVYGQVTVNVLLRNVKLAIPLMGLTSTALTQLTVNGEDVYGILPDVAVQKKETHI